MSPDKLFDYLDGRLSAEERGVLEEKLATDPHLQRELAIAREIHKGMRGSREVVGATLDKNISSAAAGIAIGRKVATAFAVLVALNVGVGLYFIGVFETKKQNAIRNEAATREQLQKSLEKTARNTLPKLTIETNEMNLSAPAGGGAAFAEKIIAAAAHAGGSAVQAPPQDHSLIVLAEITNGRENDFRKDIGVPPAAVPIGSPTPPAEEKKIIQIKISENGNAKP
jgi:anti-sigma factor RsiW